MSQLERASTLVGENKILAAGANHDSITYDNYKKDIYTSAYFSHQKYVKIFQNLNKLMQL